MNSFRKSRLFHQNTKKVSTRGACCQMGNLFAYPNGVSPTLQMTKMKIKRGEENPKNHPLSISEITQLPVNAPFLHESFGSISLCKTGLPCPCHIWAWGPNPRVTTWPKSNGRRSKVAANKSNPFSKCRCHLASFWQRRRRLGRVWPGRYTLTD